MLSALASTDNDPCSLRIALPSLLVPTNLKAPAASFAVDILPEEELEESLVRDSLFFPLTLTHLDSAFSGVDED